MKMKFKDGKGLRGESTYISAVAESRTIRKQTTAKQSITNPTKPQEKLYLEKKFRKAAPWQNTKLYSRGGECPSMA